MSGKRKNWITVVGIGEDGLEGISPAARRLIETADVLVGGKRHLAKVPKGPERRLDWKGGFDKAFDKIERNKDKKVVVLASGDPLNFGVGANVVRRFGADRVTVVPSPGAFSLAAAAMGWPLADVECLTVHGRPLEAVHLHLVPGRRLLVLSRDGWTPGKLAKLLRDRGFGPSPMTVLANMGGKETRLKGHAGKWRRKKLPDLNVIAVECVAVRGADVRPRTPGLPDDAYRHDGLITKREVRAATLARLEPLPGQVLWDVGAGSGSVGIEWLRAEPTAQAVAIEMNKKRLAFIGWNARNLGTPGLKIVDGEAPGALKGLKPPPDAVFVGGGVSRPGLLEACWRALPPGGRLVANGVTIEAQQRLLSFRNVCGGELVRIAVSRAGPVGRLHAFRPLKEVTQLVAVKT